MTNAKDKNSAWRMKTTGIVSSLQDGTSSLQSIAPSLQGGASSGHVITASLQDVMPVVGFVIAVVLSCALACVPFGSVCDFAFADESKSVVTEIGEAVAQKTKEMLGAEALPQDDYTSRVAEVGVSVTQKMKEMNLRASVGDVDYTQHVGELLQNDIMAGGCELVSLEIVMESMGVDVDLDALASDHLNMDGSYSTGYAGDPYWSGGGFAPGIAAAANSYLESQGSSLRAYDITGSSFDDLEYYLSHGYPLLVWTTMGFDDPFLTGVFDGDDEWYDNEHCVVLYGISEDGEWALVSDPLEGYVDRELARFIDIYEQCGSRAVIVR